LAIVNQVPKLGIVLKESLIELSRWSETYIMRVSVSNGFVLESWGSWGQRFWTLRGHQVHSQWRKPATYSVPSVRYRGSFRLIFEKNHQVRRTTTGRNFWSENTGFFCLSDSNLYFIC